MLPLLVLLFIVLPLVELYVLIQIGKLIGALPTIALLLLDSVLGAALARSQGRAVWRRFNQALAEGRMPARETFDGAMVILGGALMITPGFVSDFFALFLLLPPSRELIRRLIMRAVVRRGRIVFMTRTFGSRRSPRPPYPGAGRDWDYEGSAREVKDDELPGGRDA